MTDRIDGSPDAPPERPEALREELGHPRGTLAIVIIYGLLFAVIWLALYIFQFLARGAPRP